MTSLTITYGGKGGPRSGHIREGRRGVANPSFTVQANETPPLRLNSDLGLRFPPDLLSTIPTNAEKLTYLRHEITGALDLFARYQRTFLDRYFAFIVDHCADAAPTLCASAAWSGGLIRAEDYVFSALWPLPDCTLSVATEAGEQRVGDCDFAFWSGHRVIAVTLTGGAKPSDDAGHVTADMTGGLLMRITIVAADLNGDLDLFSEPRFPPELVDFWRGERVPGSPFRPEGLVNPARGLR